MNLSKWIDPAWLIERLTPMMVRYGAQAVAGVLIKMGYDGDTVAGLDPTLQTVLGGVIFLMVTLWGAQRKTSVEAHTVAKTAERVLAKGEGVVVKTDEQQFVAAVSPKPAVKAKFNPKWER